MPVSPVIWNNEFETTNVSPYGFTGTTVSAGCALAVVSTLSHHGAYSLQCDTNGSAAATQSARGNRTIAAVSLIYVRAYVRVNLFGGADNDDRLVFIRIRVAATADVLAFCGWRINGGVTKWWAGCRNAAAYIDVYGSTPSLNKWYCIELYWLNNVNGGVSLWVDGALCVSTTGRDTNDYGNPTQINFGLAEAVNCQNASKVFCDCFAYSTMPIRCESALWSLKPMGEDKRLSIQQFSTYRRGRRMGLH